MRLLRNDKKVLRRSYKGGFYEQTVESVPREDLGKMWKEFSAAFLAQAELDKGGLNLPSRKQNENYQSQLESDQL